MLCGFTPGAGDTRMSESKRNITGRCRACPTSVYLTTERRFHPAQWAGNSNAVQKNDVNMFTFPGTNLCYRAGFGAEARIRYELTNAENKGLMNGALSEVAL